MKEKVVRIRRVLRPHFLSLRLSDEELAKLNIKVSETNLPRSDYLRRLINLERRSLLPLLPEHKREIYSRLARLQHLLNRQSFGFERLSELDRADLSHTSEFSAELARLVSIHQELLADISGMKSIVLEQQEQP